MTSDAESPHNVFRRQLDLIAELSRRFADSGAMETALRQELELAGQIQRNMRGTQALEHMPILGVTLPAQEISGDFFDIVERDDGLVAFAIGDVAGKGYPAAQLMAAGSSLFRRLARGHDRPGPLLAEINDELCRLSQGDGRFVTMIAGILHTASGCLLLANAGHEPALLHSLDGRFTSLRAGAPPLGIERGMVSAAIPEKLLCLAGGCLYLFTDGVTESQGSDGMLGENGLRRMIEDAALLPPPLRLNALLGRMADPLTPPRDDLTLLLVADGRPPPILFRRGWLTALGLSAQREAVGDALRAAGADADTASDIVMAVDEACQNVLRHGYGRDGEVILEISKDVNMFTIRVIDFARASDLANITPRPIEDIAPGGLGLHFMRQAMDTVSWPPPPPGTGNLLLMTKALP
ncbi:MAG TPA: SpoIIE family protein phosphatase [Candidatus Sulfotelmatobacter sp.]|jgi:sigma-B regulation protein RsbU (phosphoserine phosphatase)|nr:SpoIIE family protein phosphatase [Candidatus Sulfotelmatobacter sp.]